tara:strand:- start:525 stop:3398 length:2874 start_codon:yes stop_codon:yes gene_type:complete
MQVDCNKTYNRKALKLLDGIEKWASTDMVARNIQSPYQAAMSMFESRFNIEMEYAMLLSPEQGGAFLTSGNINSFIRDLNRYAQRVDSGKFTQFETTEGFMVGTVLGKRDPVLAESLKNLRKIVDNDNKRRDNINKQFKDVVDQIRASGGITGAFSTSKLNSALKKHRQLEIDYIKTLDSGTETEQNEARKVLQDFENSGSVKTFVDFIRVVEDKMPKAIDIKYKAEKALAEGGDKDAINRVEQYDSGKKLVRLTDSETRQYLEQLGVSPDVISPLIKYNSLMEDSYRILRNGIDEKINIVIKQIENKKGFKLTVDNLNALKENLRSRLMPRYSEGYFPHFTKQFNAKMMDGMMKHFDELDTALIDMKHDSKSIDEIIRGINVAIPDYGKSRQRDGYNEYSMNFIDVVNTYINDVNKFNTQVFVKSGLIDSLNKARSMYNKESQYAGKIVDIINSLYGSVNGRVKNTGSMHEIKKALLSYQFTNKLGFSVRSAARNATQYLMNYATFGYSAVRESRKYLNEKRATEIFGGDLDDFMKKENLFMDTSEALIESGISSESASFNRIRRMDENGKIVYADEESFLYKGSKIFATKMGQIANISAGLHRGVENANRKLTAEIAFAQIQKIMDNNPKFQQYLENKVRVDKENNPESKLTVQSLRRSITKNYAKNMVILNHFDYEGYAKARNMREGVGQFLFQFQHYGMEFLERNWSIYKEAQGDRRAFMENVVRGEDSFSNWVKDARGVHKAMNVSVAYFMAPLLISYVSGYNQTLIEHTGKEFLDDLWLLFTSDYDDPDAIEKINREFYGKGIVGSKLGPTFATMMDVGVMMELINADSEYLDNILFTVGDYANDDTMETYGRYARLLNQMGGRTYDRYIPMTAKTPYGLGAAAMQELTLYPKKKDERTIYRDIIEPTTKEAFPTYYFDRLERKTKSKKKRYTGLPIEIQNSLKELERRGR